MALGWTATGPETLANTYVGQDLYGPSVNGLTAGGYVVTWSTFGADGNGFHVRGQRFNADGQSEGDEFLLNPLTHTDMLGHSINALDDGGYLLTWTTWLPGSPLRNVFGLRFDANGEAIGDKFQINTNVPNYASDFATAVLSDGGFVVAWRTHNDGGLYGQRFDANGVAEGPEFQIGAVTYGQLDPAITGLNNGGFVMTWSSFLQDGSRYGVFGQVYDGNGALVGNEFQINTYTVDNQNNTSVTNLTDGGFFVAWQSPAPNSDTVGVFGQRYNANGTKFGEETQLNSNIGNPAAGPTVEGLPDGGYVVVWQTHFGSHGQRYDAAGDTVGPAFQLNTFSYGTSQSPDISILADGGIVATWRGQASENSTIEVFVRQFAAELWGTNQDDTIIDHVGANWLNGQAGNDMLQGLAGADTMFGDDGADTMFGNAGNDRMFGQAGFDIMDGGAGDDTMFGNRGNDTMEGGTGRDTMNGGIGQDDMSGGDGADTLLGEAGNDALRGGTGRDSLNGGADDDTIHGGSDNDQLIGNQGDDVLYGGTGNDHLFGNAGDDLLNGNAGDDRMNGGAGADVFVFAQGADRAMDFTDDVDTLRFDEALWGGTALTPSEILDFATVTGSDLVFDFGAGNTLTLVGYTDTSSLLDDITSF